MNKTSEYLGFACQTAKKAGDIAMKVFRRDFKTEYKVEEGRLSPVTDADKLCEYFILSSIKKKFPGHGIISEEAGAFKEKEEWVWYIDPLDGTRNFSHKIPHFSVSIALLHKGNALCGAVYDPNRKELFSSENGKGAYLNGKRISVSETKNMKNAIVSLDGAMTPDIRKSLPEVVSKIVPEVEAMRIFGGAALGLCYLACGRNEGMVNLKCHPHDIAAGGLILKEAGGTIEDPAGEETFPSMTRYVAGTPFVARQLISILNA